MVLLVDFSMVGCVSVLEVLVFVGAAAPCFSVGHRRYSCTATARYEQPEALTIEKQNNISLSHNLYN
jgi:hypothetical protein